MCIRDRALENINEEEFSMRQLFKIKPTDKYIIACMCISTLIVWTPLIFSKKSENIMLYNDGPHLLHISNHFYSFPSEKFHSNTAIKCDSYVNSIPIGAPLLLRVIKTILFGYWLPSCMIFMLITNIICAIVFERFISLWQIVRDQVFTSCLLSIFPTSFFIDHSTFSTCPIYMTFVFLAFIGYKKHKVNLIFYSVLVSAFFDRQSGSLMLSFFIIFFQNGHYAYAFKTLLAYLIPIVIQSGIQFFKTQTTFLSFFINNKSMGKLPFSSMLYSIAHMKTEEFYAQWYYFVALLVGASFLSRYSISLLIFSLTSFAIDSFFLFKDLWKYASAYHVFTILLGFDIIISNEKFKKIRLIFIILYGIISFIYVYKSISGRGFMNSQFLWDEIKK